MRLYLIYILLIGLSFRLSAQKRKDTLIDRIELATVAQANQGESYITFPTDIGNIEPLWFEANIVPNFNIRKSKDSRFLGVLTPQIIIRMYQEESFPVRTPSYMPQITLYYSLISRKEVKNLSLFGRIAHHSNGQDGNFYTDSGYVNYKNGSFATNYFEFGGVHTRYNVHFNAVMFFSSSFEWHPKALSIDELLGIYSRYRWNNIFSIFKLPRDVKKHQKASISLKGELSWNFGEMYDWDAWSYKRINAKFTFYYHPKFFEDIGFFAEIYTGMDYYNIYFNHYITVMRFGIMTEKLRF